MKTTTTEVALESLPFESVLNQLEQVINKLESGELPLEQALDEFERGVYLTRCAQQQLQQAEQRIQILLNDADEVELAPFAN